ncbi:ZYRO0G12496p [Zygosaccharomyces rouxii]|uniref:ZYRO0G12496p n=1 Tax=Zygosaccharomyces rouxii (strain ATCC 2623 / CBS 732 / NBRC 1130 / NCYC 568 / NRRL Y-229) TaxID=559307 RepID=C5E0G4_ZYGRC|nr:uncharacterized protein ZYRO0G12496g [Zygosaccharomyces rouxii]KAH9202591.1 hypothetical protein LQ764DRAFT_26758 [Zygosaccharomyces rouxii]CAR29598.1 ZYRO0G12496p [Zygosaccharomyces rouxii]
MSGFKKNDLYIYELSPPVLNSLQLMVFDATLREVQKPLENEREASSVDVNQLLEKRKISNSLQCGLCSLEFKDQDTRRGHFKTSFHTFNVKRSLKGLNPVSQIEFEEIVQGGKIQSKTPPSESEPESESESSMDEKEDSDNDELEDNKEEILEETIARELEQLSLNGQQNAEESAVSHLATRSSQLYFKSQLLSESQVFGLYKSLFDSETIKKPFEQLKVWNETEDQASSISALFMMGGGHFAGAIVSHQRTSVQGNPKKQEQSLQEQAVNFIEHKTFHRYTTRRKQGGSQSAMDNAKGKANSAGSSLRRYNEAALRSDIHNLLKEWKPYLAKCKNIFLRARNPQDKRLFIEMISQGSTDQRLKSFPFTTGRPNVAELKRSWCELTHLKIAPKPEPLPINETPSGSTKASQKAQKEKLEPIKEISPEEKHTEQLLSLLNKGRAPLIVAYLRNNKIDVNFNLSPELQHFAAPTLLHYASQQGLKQMVTILLTNLKANPCLKNKVGKTPWDVSKNSQTRYSFQIARHILGENFANWEEAHVKEPLSREQVEKINKEEEQRANSEAEALIKKELDAARIRQREEEEERKLEKDAKRGTGRVLDSSTVNREQNLNSLTDEQRRRLMREQRARAAEARMNIRK